MRSNREGRFLLLVRPPRQQGANHRGARCHRVPITAHPLLARRANKTKADIGLALTALWKQNIQIVKQIDCYTKNRTALEHDLKIAYVTLFNAFHPMLQECARGLHEAKKLNKSGLSVEIAQKIWDQLVKYRSRWYCQL